MTWTGSHDLWLAENPGPLPYKEAASPVALPLLPVICRYFSWTKVGGDFLAWLLSFCPTSGCWENEIILWSEIGSSKYLLPSVFLVITDVHTCFLTGRKLSLCTDGWVVALPRGRWQHNTVKTPSQWFLAPTMWHILIVQNFFPQQRTLGASAFSDCQWVSYVYFWAHASIELFWVIVGEYMFSFTPYKNPWNCLYSL